MKASLALPVLLVGLVLSAGSARAEDLRFESAETQLAAALSQLGYQDVHLYASNDTAVIYELSAGEYRFYVACAVSGQNACMMKWNCPQAASSTTLERLNAWNCEHWSTYAYVESGDIVLMLAPPRQAAVRCEDLAEIVMAYEHSLEEFEEYMEL